MTSRQYARNRETRAQRRDRLERARMQAVEALTPKPILASEPSLRGAGVVTPPRKVKYRRPRHVRRNQGYYANNGAFIPFAEAPYTELMRDVGTPRNARTTRTTQASAAVAPKRDDRSLMASMGTIHGNTQ